MPKIKIALSIDVPGFTSLELFSFAKDAGFDGIDYVSGILDLFSFPQKILKQSIKFNLPVLSIHQPLPLTIITPAFLFGRMISLAKIFKDLNVSNQHLSGYLNLFKRDINFLKNFMRVAKENNVIISFESNPTTGSSLHFFPKETYEPELFGEFSNLHNFSITMDTSHIADNNFDIIKFFKIYNRNIRLIHLSDYSFKNKTQHLPLGEGELPLKKLFEEIRKVKWNGLIVFEIIKFPNAHSKKEKLSSIKKSLDFVRQSL